MGKVHKCPLCGNQIYGGTGAMERHFHYVHHMTEPNAKFAAQLCDGKDQNDDPR